MPEMVQNEQNEQKDTRPPPSPPRTSSQRKRSPFPRRSYPENLISVELHEEGRKEGRKMNFFEVRFFFLFFFWMRK